MFLPYEKELFLWINTNHTPFMDTFMYLYTSKFFWVPLAITAFYVLVRKMKLAESILIIFSLILIAVLCDQISASIIKPMFARYRPAYHPDFKDLVTNVYGYTGGSFGFVSSHAANGMGVVSFGILAFRNKYYTIIALFWLSITAYSRIYLGVHFVSDVIGGLLLGAIIGISCYFLYRKARYYLLGVSEKKLNKASIPLTNINILINAKLISIFAILICTVVINAFFLDNLRVYLHYFM